MNTPPRSTTLAPDCLDKSAPAPVLRLCGFYWTTGAGAPGSNHMCTLPKHGASTRHHCGSCDAEHVSLPSDGTTESSAPAVRHG